MNVCKLVLDVAFSLGVILATQIQALPESAAAGTHHTAEGFRRRTEAYHGHNKTAGKRSAVSFFEDAAKLEVLEVANGASTNVGDVLVSTLQPYVDQGGTAYNYHPTEDEVAEAEAKAKAEEVNYRQRPLHMCAGRDCCCAVPLCAVGALSRGEGRVGGRGAVRV